MDYRNEAMAELARDASLERSDFLVRAGEQLERFIDANRDRIRALGGLVLIDADDDYLAIAPDSTFRSRSRAFDEVTGQWVSETEVIESAAELVELYNPADIYGAFAEVAEEGAREDGEEDEDEGDEEGAEPEGDEAQGAGQRRLNGEDPYAGAADRWAAARPDEVDDSDEGVARRLYDLALDYQERSQATEGRLLEQFQADASELSSRLGEVVITEDDDERLVLATGARFRGSVLSEESGKWEALEDAGSIVEYYDPTDVFSDLADAIAEAWPSVAPGLEEAGESEAADQAGEPAASEGDGDADDEDGAAR